MTHSTTRYSRSIANLFKRSFSLVEAAIYLMLVGVLTMAVIGGAALIEKAKIQKVIEDIEYYEKAVRNFTIQFGNLPGNLTIKRCNENIDIFKVCKSQKWGALNLGDTTYVGTSGMFDSYITFTPFPFMQM